MFHAERANRDTDMRRGLIVLLLAGCSTTSGVMESEGGTYLISARASWELGGTAGANSAAYAEAQRFCAVKALRPIVLNASERDLSGGGGAITPSGGFFGGQSGMWGNANLRFRCE
jgi:hypothetical protein